MYTWSGGHPALLPLEQVPTSVPFSLASGGTALAPHVGSHRVLHLRDADTSEPSLALHRYDEPRCPVGPLSRVPAGERQEFGQLAVCVRCA